MSNNFTLSKYAAVASAVAVACGSAASMAATLKSPTATNVARAAMLTAVSTADISPAGPVSFSLLGSYAAQDTVVFTVGNAALRQAPDATGTASLTCVDNSNAGRATTAILFGAAGRSTNSLTFRVTGDVLSGLGKSSFSCALTAASLSITRNSVSSVSTAGVTLSVTSYIGATSSVIDTTAAAGVAQLARAYDQFSVASISKFSGTIDVATNRRAWSSASTSKSISFVLSSIDNNATALTIATDNPAVTFNSSIYGATTGGPAMFSWLDDTGAGCTAAELTAGPGSASITSGGTLSISSNCATLTASFPAAVGTSTTARTVTVTLSKASTTGGLAIQSGGFLASSSFVVSNATSYTQTLSAADAGTFGINGALINIPYMPYGTSGTSAITQSYYITNKSATAGAVTGSARNQAGVACDLGSVGVAAAQAVTNLSAGINSAVAACYATGGVFPDGTRVYIDLVSNTDQISTIVNSSYNVGGNSRVVTTNDSTQVTGLQGYNR